MLTQTTVGAAMLKRRTKLVSFRLSDEEYESLQGACVAEGARSISDFARAALQRTVRGQTHGTDSESVRSGGADTRELIDTMRELNRQLSELVSIAQAAGTRR